MMRAMTAINSPADSVEGEQGRVKTCSALGRSSVEGEHGRVKTQFAECYSFISVDGKHGKVKTNATRKGN